MGKFKLLREIEKLREELNYLFTENGQLSKEVIHKSQELDNLLNEYYKKRSNCL